MIVNNISVFFLADKPINTVLYSNATNNTIAFGKSVGLHCKTNSIPAAQSFSFYHNGLLLAESNNGVFVIPNVQRSNAGLINCHPRNVLGVGDTAHVNLTVVYEGMSSAIFDLKKSSNSHQNYY